MNKNMLISLAWVLVIGINFHVLMLYAFYSHWMNRIIKYFWIIIISAALMYAAWKMAQFIAMVEVCK